MKAPHDRPGSAERRIAAAFGLSALAALGLTAVYVSGGQPQLEGVLLAISLGGIGAGLVEWARHLMPPGPESGDYGPMPSAEVERAGLDAALERGEEILGRRKLLVRMLGLAASALGLAALLPIRSLGPSPGRVLLVTAWRRGLRLVTEDGRTVRAGDLVVGGVLTVFPEGHTDAADSQALLIRVGPNRNLDRPGRVGWTPQGHVAFSKICTHAGCPVGLYRAATNELYCPCHQSTFDVVDAARPIFGPATRPLPQLPLSIDREGFLVARGDFSGPVGPAFWKMGRP